MANPPVTKRLRPLERLLVQGGRVFMSVKIITYACRIELALDHPHYRASFTHVARIPTVFWTA